MNTTNQKNKTARQTNLMSFGATVNNEIDLLSLFKVREPRQIRVEDAEGTTYIMWE